MIFAMFRSRFEQSRIALVRRAQRTDAFCARLDPGLAALAIVLLLAVAVLWINRHPEISEANNPAADTTVDMAESGAAAIFVIGSGAAGIHLTTRAETRLTAIR
jgi:hypothetical protein